TEPLAHRVDHRYPTRQLPRPTRGLLQLALELLAPLLALLGLALGLAGPLLLGLERQLQPLDLQRLAGGPRLPLGRAGAPLLALAQRRPGLERGFGAHLRLMLGLGAEPA